MFKKNFRKVIGLSLIGLPVLSFYLFYIGLHWEGSTVSNTAGYNPEVRQTLQSFYQWETYTNTHFGFTVKYPVYMSTHETIRTHEGQDSDKFFSVYFFVSDKKQSEFVNPMVLTLEKVGNFDSIEDWYTTTYGRHPPDDYLVCQTTIINNLEAMGCNYADGLGKPIFPKSYYIYHNGFVYTFSPVEIVSQDAEAIALYDRIVNSFRMTNQSL